MKTFSEIDLTDMVAFLRIFLEESNTYLWFIMIIFIRLKNFTVALWLMWLFKL